MRLLYVADGRSPIARGWIEGFIRAENTVHLASTYRCEPIKGLASLQFVPVAFSGRKARGASGGGGAGGIGLRTRLRQWLGPLTVPWRGPHLRGVIQDVDPDLVHALRVPFEGMLAGWADPEPPLVVSTWGNDFTLHAEASPLMAWLTRRTLARVDGLHTDCERDRRLATLWGLPSGVQEVVLPGNGGLPELFFRDEISLDPESEVRQLLERLDPDHPLVVQPRGFRAYVRNDTFFRSLPFIYQSFPQAVVVCPTMSGESQAEHWKDMLGPERDFVLLGALTQREMAALLRRAWVVVSPTEHDGTPNSLLEAMACGAVPVAGDLESLREWIQDGETGRLVDPESPLQLGQAVVELLEDSEFRARAAERNRELVHERARRERVLHRAQAFYEQVLGSAK